jgi:ribose transport system permease protein
MTITTGLRNERSATSALRLLRDYAVVWVTLALVVFLTVTTENFLTVRNLQNVLDQQSTVLIVAVATTLTVIAGGFDVSLSAIFVLTPLVAVQVMNSTGSIAVGVFSALLAGAAAGASNAFVVTVMKINSFIATLASSFVLFGVAYVVSDKSILRPNDIGFANFATARIFGITNATWIAVAVVVICWVTLESTQFGRYVFAAGGNPEAARLAGVRATGVLAITFVIGGLCAGLAGAVNASQNMSAQASDDFSFVFGVVAAVVVGGTSIAGGIGSVWRTVVGVFFIAFLVNGFNLNGIDPIYQRIIQGLVIIAAVAIDSWSRTRTS